MYRLLAAVCFFCLLLSCNDEKKFDPLNEPPYDKITDSIRKEPKNAGLYYRRGALLNVNDQPVFAAKDIRQAWELQPKEEYALSLVTLYKEKNTDTAIAFINEALKKLPASIALQIGLARGYQQKDETEKAITICNNILAQFPNQLDALILKAELLKQQNKNEEAITILEKAYSYAPGDVELVHALAFDYAEAKNPKVLPLADSLIAVDLQNAHAEPHYFKGVYYSNAGNAAEAIRQFDAAIQRNFNYMDAYINKGVVYYDQKKFAEALKTFSLATTVSPTYADAYYWMGKTEEAMGNKAEAKLNYQRAYGLDKTIKEAKEAAERLK